MASTASRKAGGNFEGHLAYLAAQALKAHDAGDLKFAMNCGLELARFAQGARPAPSPLLVSLARTIARKVIAWNPEHEEAAQAAEDVLAEEDPHICLGHAAYMAAALPHGYSEPLTRGLVRVGYTGPYEQRGGGLAI